MKKTELSRRRVFFVLVAFLISFAVTVARAQSLTEVQVKKSSLVEDNALIMSGAASTAGGVMLASRGYSNPFVLAATFGGGATGVTSGSTMKAEEKRRTSYLTTDRKEELADLIRNTVRVASFQVDTRYASLSKNGSIKQPQFQEVVDSLKCSIQVSNCLGKEKQILVANMVLDLAEIVEDEFEQATLLGLVQKQTTPEEVNRYILRKTDSISSSPRMFKVVKSFDMRDDLTSKTIYGIILASVIDGFGFAAYF